MEATRTSNQSTKILKKLKENRFVTNLELNSICYRYSARIHELRADGHLIERDYVKPGVYRYWLVRQEKEYGDV